MVAAAAADGCCSATGESLRVMAALPRERVALAREKGKNENKEGETEGEGVLTGGGVRLQSADTLPAFIYFYYL